jgi:hypothetical protein
MPALLRRYSVSDGTSRENSDDSKEASQLD